MPRIPPKGRPIQKGEVRNPNGSSARARQQAALRRAHKTLSADEFAKYVSMFMQGTPKSMGAQSNDPDASVLEKILAKLLIKAHDKGDITIFKALLEATIGKPRERRSTEISGPDGGPIQTTTRSDAEILAEINQLRAQRDAVEKSKR